ncbi:uncharacterized protein LOC131224868 [Magnolia sinica]|uniref:uncharacterized protein LOC131224868 n=1 Tax=Magnolia sinica TaxID=86752 RepID=UPI00265AC249|nr:uncharacterized protein LOC131224868 [Magnolia sinica]
MVAACSSRAHFSFRDDQFALVEKIPGTFLSIEHYLKSYFYPLLEETRAELHSSLAAVSEAPFAEIIAIEESNFSYYIDVGGWESASGVGGHETYKPRAGDIFILSNDILEAVADLHRHDMTYILGSVRVELHDETWKGFRIRVSKSSEVTNGINNLRYAVYVTNITTNIRMWKALRLETGVEISNLNMIKAVLNSKPSDNDTCKICSSSRIGVWANKFNSNFISFNLNKSQVEAVVSAVSAINCNHSHSVQLIWGPPGTGKTKTVGTLLWSLLAMNCRTLTCAPTNIAVTQVCSHLLSLVRESFRRDDLNQFPCFPFGDVVLFGNKDRMIMDEDSHLKEIFLDYRVDRLAECFAPLSGWSHKLFSLIALLEDSVFQYRTHLKNKMGKRLVGFREFLWQNFNAITLPLQNCIRLLSVHLPRTLISECISTNLVTLSDLLETFGSLLCNRDVSEEELAVLFNPEDPQIVHFPSMDSLLSAGALLEGSVRTALDKTRRECIRIARVLHGTLDLPIAVGKDWIRSFCLKNATLIFCTASAASSLQNYEMDPLEALVVDEAAQLKECESVIALRIKGIKHAVLIGDERQLPSIVKSKVSDAAGFGRSLFERLGSMGHHKHLLNMQYRMHPAISTFPNAKFYDGRILDGPNVTDAIYGRHCLHGRMYGAYSFINIADGREEKDYIGSSFKNMVEVAVVVQIVRSLFKSWQGTGQSLSIGVVSPYSAQVNAIQGRIAKQYESRSGFSVKVKSIDGFQGGEEDVIILSTVRSSSKGSVGFLANRNRTNVALTRARHSLWILGKASTLARSGSIWEELINDVKERGLFFNANEDAALSKAILQVKHELNQLNDLFKPDSILLGTTVWKVRFSNDFQKSFAKLKYLQVKHAVIQLLLRLAEGWRPRRRSIYFPDSYKLAKQCRVRGLYLIWTVDIEIIKDERYIQVLKVWDILSMVEIPNLVNRLDINFALYTDDYIKHCRERCLDGKLEVPMSWHLGKDIIRFKKLCKTEPVEASGKRGLEVKKSTFNVKVSENLLLMKFYSSSSGVVKHLLTDTEGKEIDLPFGVTEQEKEILRFSSSTFILGSLGTGKTMVLTMKLIQREQQHYISSKGLSGVRDGSFEFVCEKNELGADPAVGKAFFLRQIFVTVSAKLCASVRSHICRLQSFTSGGGSSNSASSTATNLHDIGDSLTDFMDVPDSFVDLPHKHYPLVITFQKFLMMLDGTMSNSFFNKFRAVRELSVDRKSLALKAFIRSKEVNLECFISSYWPHFNAKLTKKLDPSIVFTQIISHIKGGLQVGGDHDGKLGREGYILLSEGRVSILSREEREMIYDIFLEYEKKKEANGEFDSSDLVTYVHHRLGNEGFVGEKFDFVYVDEVQDLTVRQIELFKYICNNFQEGFVFAGDTAKTIARGIDFRFQDIRSLFYREFLSELSGCKERGKVKEMQVSNVFHLNQNFQTRAGVLKLARSVMDLLYHFFPSSVDVLSPEISPIHGKAPEVLNFRNGENAIMSIFGSSGSSVGASGFGAELVILVRDDISKKQIFNHVGKQALVLTVIECKGLEFQDVLLYDFFGSSPLKAQWRVIYEFMKDKCLLDAATPTSFPFDMANHSILCSELKQLYLAITRARQRLWICESIEDLSKPMFDYWKKKCLVQVRHWDQSLVQDMQTASSTEDWRLRGTELFNEGKFEMAMNCFKQAGDEFREKWAKAAAHHANAERIFSTNFEMARTELTQAAGIYESIGKADAAAYCFTMLKELKTQGRRNSRTTCRR